MKRILNINIILTISFILLGNTIFSQNQTTKKPTTTTTQKSGTTKTTATTTQKTEPAKPEQPIEWDTIIKLTGRKLACKIVNIRTNIIYYYLPEKKEEILELDRKNVNRIIYIGGKKEVFNQLAVSDVVDSWQAIVVTEEKSMVEFMYKICNINAESGSDVRSMQAAKSSATVKLQKKAASKNANVILITKSEAKGGFGDVPAYYIEGTCYSFDPPPQVEGTDNLNK